ncbi:MAG: hypothetical protein LCH86_20740 [Proteobacteria bacterium]|nr:hypothetical protein [Pseudomonadota bacterium]
MSTTMRAKMKVSRVERWDGADKVTMNAVCRTSGYPADGSDEDNTYAKFSPQGELTLTIANPALVGMIEPGTTYYLDFTPAG